MKLQVLISTMHQKNYNLIEKMNIQSDALVVNQCSIDSSDEFEFRGNKINWYDCQSRGLSRSRNKAISMAESDICLVSDDDIVYIDNYKDVIIDQFNKNPKADVIAFQVEGIGKEFKKYSSSPISINYITSMKISSVEIAFKLDSIKKNELQFNELFGSGSHYIMGEENIFLFECLRRKLNIIYVPIKIADLHQGESTWFKGFNKDYLIHKGAVFTGMSKRYSPLLILQFAIRKHKLFYPNIGFLESIKFMLQGRKQFLNDFRNE